jgi:lipopolysaccharide transport system ATP-binding protein
MSSEIAIKVENLSKCYQIYDQPRDRLKQFIMPRLQRSIGRQPRKYFREFWAIQDVSFEIKKGETVGIIGRNGSGKSTLLQMICGTLNPTSGNVRAEGRIAALLELGSGFNPDFTGRENVYMNGAVLGLSKDEVDNSFDDIAAFADIGDFIEQPVKTYSSGMFVRLAFAVNIMSRPEIMIVDEALAVGDMAFQAKCMTALKRMQDRGVTVLFVSHDIGSVKSLCSQAVYLERGQIRSSGKASAVAEGYVRIVREEMNAQNFPINNSFTVASDKENSTSSAGADFFKTSEAFDRRVAEFRYGNGGAKITFVELVDLDGQSLVSVEFDQEVKIRIFFTSLQEAYLSPNYYILDDKKNLIVGAGLRTVGESLLHCESGGKYVVTYTTTLPLQEGNYSIQFQISKPLVADQTAEFLDVIDDAIVFNIQRKAVGRIWTKVYLSNAVEIKKI